MFDTIDEFCFALYMQRVHVECLSIFEISMLTVPGVREIVLASIVIGSASFRSSGMATNPGCKRSGAPKHLFGNDNIGNNDINHQQPEKSKSALVVF
jgi:hypothetical protein